MTLEEIGHRIEIDDLLTRYTIAIDDEDFDSLDTVFTPDAVLDYTSAGGPRDRYPAVKEWLRTRLSARSPARLHMLGNKLVKLDGPRATVRAYFFNPFTLDTPEGVAFSAIAGEAAYSIGGGFYNHKLELRPEGWRSVELFELRVWRHGYPPRPHPHAARSTETWDFGAPPRPRT